MEYCSTKYFVNEEAVVEMKMMMEYVLSSVCSIRTPQFVTNQKQL